MEIREIRNKNLLALIYRHGQTEVQRRLGYDSMSFISQLKKDSQPMGTKVARKLEAAFSLQNGWMDGPHPELWQDPEKSIDEQIEALLSDKDADYLKKVMHKAIELISSKS